MKKIRAVSLLSFFLILFSLAVAPSAAALQTVTYEPAKDVTITAQAAVVVHLSTAAEKDMLLFSKNSDKALSPAGMVRIMVGVTAVALMEEKQLNMDTSTGTYTQACFEAIAGSGIPTAGMEIGDVWTLRDLLTISMIQSAGDTVETLAYTLAGSETAFVQRMNQLAATLGCTNSVFKNVTGNDVNGQVSSAMDMYRILRHALDNADLQAMLSMSFYTAKPKKGAEITLPSTNNLLRSSTDSFYAPALLGRSGFSDIDGPGVAAVSRDNGYEYMVVVMGASKTKDGSQFTDAKNLFRWAFRDFSLTTLRTKNDPIANLKVRLCWGQDRVQLVPKEDFTAIIPNKLDVSAITVKSIDVPEVVNAPIRKGETYGKVAFCTPDGQQIGTCDLVADQSLSRNQWLFVWYCIGRFFSSGWFWGGLLLLMVLIGGYVLLTIHHNKQRRQHHQQKIKPYK